jgi:hypothetical protein
MKWSDKRRGLAMLGIILAPIFASIFALTALLFWSPWPLAMTVVCLVIAQWSTGVIYRGNFPRRPSA